MPRTAILSMQYTCMRTTLGSPAATSRGSLFGRGRACHAPMQVRYFAYMATHVCMPGTAMTLDAIGVYMHAHDLPNLALPQHPRGVPFSAVHAPACTNAGTLIRIYGHTCMHARNFNDTRCRHWCIHACMGTTCPTWPSLSNLEGGMFLVVHKSAVHQCMCAASDTYPHAPACPQLEG